MTAAARASRYLRQATREAAAEASDCLYFANAAQAATAAGRFADAKRHATDLVEAATRQLAAEAAAEAEAAAVHSAAVAATVAKYAAPK